MKIEILYKDDKWYYLDLLWGEKKGGGYLYVLLLDEERKLGKNLFAEDNREQIDPTNIKQFRVNNSNLEWGKTADKKMTWQEAMDFCKNLDYAGHKDWRLPTRVELINAFDSGQVDGFEISDYYWSSTTYVNNTILAWYVDFFNGNVANYYKTIYSYVRPVREVEIIDKESGKI